MTPGLLRQIGRFGLVGLCVVALDYAIFAASLWAVTSNYLAANAGGKVAGAVAGFILHKHISFAGQQRDKAGVQALSYAALFGFNLILSTGLLWMLVDHWHLNAYASRLFVDALVIVTSFTGSKLWVYRKA
jgi:putative flippase GtrA